ncbi:hypothetical protein BDN70DRAFT_932274 [Pholiota conissans]|uniref:Uncharacterized protein n=1 Tax=Pholiota conissans TaxID=109636 RepID=A0A9P6D0Z0_9AGAR|nr:hypothetical protein BDN70DRAFT_932274 [Pholiota conissans]
MVFTRLSLYLVHLHLASGIWHLASMATSLDKKDIKELLEFLNEVKYLPSHIYSIAFPAPVLAHLLHPRAQGSLPHLMESLITILQELATFFVSVQLVLLGDGWMFSTVWKVKMKMQIGIEVKVEGMIDQMRGRKMAIMGNRSGNKVEEEDEDTPGHKTSTIDVDLQKVVFANAVPNLQNDIRSRIASTPTPLNQPEFSRQNLSQQYMSLNPFQSLKYWIIEQCIF